MAQAFADKNYLVIDDFPDMRAAIRSILRSLGVNRIDQARDGNDAITQMQIKHYDVVLCDYNLGPGKDGQQVLEEARHRLLLGVDSIFIMITAENARDMVMGAVEYAPDSYLAKPFTKDLLKKRLDKLFERKAHLKRVDKALVAKDYGAAIAELDALIAAAPKNLSELFKLKAEICLAAHRYDDAMAICEQVLAGREIVWARLGMGKSLLGKKRYAEAQEIFRQLLETDRNLIAAYDCLARSQTALQQFTEAEATLRRAVKLSPRGLRRQQMLGELALNNGHGPEAEIAFAQAVNLAKHSVLNHPSLFAGLAKSKSANNKHGEALKIIGEIGKVFADNPEAAFYKATVTAIVKQGQGDTAGATEALHAAEQAMTEFGEASHSRLGLEMAKTCAQLGEQDKAARLLHKAIANNHDDDEFLMEIVQTCREAGVDYDAETAIREIQKRVVTTNNRGVRLIKEGEFDAAIALLHEACEEMPGNKTINLNAAKACIMKMEKLGATAEDLLAVRRYVERLHALAPQDWRLAEVTSRLRKLTPQT